MDLIADHISHRFGTLEVLGRETCLVRISQAIEKL